MLRLRPFALGVLALCFLYPACTLTPDAEEIAPDDAEVAEEPLSTESESRPTEESVNPEKQATASTEDEAPAIPVEKLDYKGVRGGKITIDLEGSPEEVLEMLLDFEHADGKRAWAKNYVLLGREGDSTAARWHFEGKAGMNPTCELRFDTVRRERDIVLRYRLTKPDFGLQAFFGDYRMTARDTTPPTTRLVERVFIDSGVFIANATDTDIAEGLREDAKLMTEWMTERLANGQKAGGD